MVKFFYLLAIFLFLGIFIFNPQSIFAQSPSFTNIVNPVRGDEFWELPNQQPKTAILGQLEILRQAGLPATWLIRYDALENKELVSILTNIPQSHEKGLFLEITPTWTAQAKVEYRKSEFWHFAGSAFLTGYEQKERELLIDTAFDKFKNTFGYLPKSVGAWWIDSFSLSYMQQKYGVTSALIVADQFSTDNYQIWGQYFGTPYYPNKFNALIPAQTQDNKIPLVMLQWAARDPLNGYGEGVKESTYSVQANDYIDFHELNIDYFTKLFDIYASPGINKFAQITIGLENSYSWTDYGPEYKKQIDYISKKKSAGLQVVTMSGFSNWYKNAFPSLSPTQIIVANDPLGSDSKVVWFMNPYYRAGWFYDRYGSNFRDIRPYVEGQKEVCYDKPCEKIDFATTVVTRVLDDVTFKQKWVIDSGKIKDLKITLRGDKYFLIYLNEAGKERIIEFWPRDMSIDGSTTTIDGNILKGTSQKVESIQKNFGYSKEKSEKYKETLFEFSISTVKFLLFLIFILFIPGFLISRNLKTNLSEVWFLSISIGMVSLTLAAFLFGYLKVSFLIYLLLSVIYMYAFIKKNNRETLLTLLKSIRLFRLSKFNLILTAVVLLGTYFQTALVIKSGIISEFGIGFLGPLGHDGIWHQALINQLVKSIPPQNPIFSSEALFNYHYFYNLLISQTHQIIKVPVMDLIYRFFPVLFSLLLGWGSYLLVNKIFNNLDLKINKKYVSLIALFLVYFGGSFGYVVEFIRERHFGGESAFWINQPVSINLNPPFAVSLILLLAFVLTFSIFSKNRNKSTWIILVLLAGSLIEFKVYAGILALSALFMVSLQRIINKDFSYIKSFTLSLLVSLAVFLPQNSKSGELLVFSPFWFIHSMVDFSDRVGWQRLSQARMAYFERGDYLKYILAEILSLVIFILGNLGTRFFALLSVFVLVRKKLFKDPFFALLSWICLFSFLIPTIFIQKGNPWNTIQFSYYLLFFTAIFAAFWIIFLVSKLPRFISIAVVISLLLATPLSAFMTFKSNFYPTPPSRLTLNEYEALTFLSNLPDGTVLTYPFDKDLRAKFKDPFPLFVYDTTAYVSAFSNKATFLEDTAQLEILQADYKKRLVGSTDFFKGRDLKWSKQFLTDNKIKYIYIPKIFHFSPDSDKLGLKQLFENEEVKIYEVI